MYVKLKKKYRPCELKFVPFKNKEEAKVEDEELYYQHTTFFDPNDWTIPPKSPTETPFIYDPKVEERSPSPNDYECPERRMKVVTEPHEDCYFIAKDDYFRWNLTRNLFMSPEEMERVVKAFLTYGKDFAKIARFCGLKNADCVQHFYDTYNQQCRLDYLIAQFDRKNLAVLGPRNGRYRKRKPRKPRSCKKPPPSNIVLRRTTRRRTVRELS
ncbi:hypothetical protein L596_005121 [Steinernema carpocapsae]|uniref:SANT domain-containing protein n=1 Tax=Steinernema carpocapsae TaxID=34508 RepID=A0A4U8UY82_STECR|nr:hypothetical protein L596_005121 [Steinernema carpocapsae]